MAAPVEMLDGLRLSWRLAAKLRVGLSKLSSLLAAVEVWTGLF